jgi:hypothetical protein
LVRTDEIEGSFSTDSYGLPIGVFDFRDKESQPFSAWYGKAMREQISFHFLVRGQIAIWITRQDMDFVALFCEFMAQMKNDPACAANGVREENIC